MLSVEKQQPSDVFPSSKIEFLKRHYAKDATAEEFEHFASVCRTRGLSPEANQIYFMKVSGRASIVLSINAYRLIAQRTGAYAGTSPVQYEFNGKGELASATVTVQKLVQGRVCDFSGTALLNEHFRSARDGRKSLWDTMPATMLEKCAEAKALRKAFPEELSGFYIRDEMDVAEPVPAKLSEAEPIVVTSDPKVKAWLEQKLRAAEVPESDWIEIIDSLNGYPKSALLMELKKRIDEFSATQEEAR